MNKGLLEEEIFTLAECKIAFSPFGRFEVVKGLLVTTFRIQYEIDNVCNKILLSGVKTIAKRRRLLVPCVRIDSVCGIYMIACNDMELLFEKLSQAYNINKSNHVIGTLSKMGGIARIIEQRGDKSSNIGAFGANAFTDLESLKAKSERLIAMLKNMGANEATISDLFSALNVSSPLDKKHDTNVSQLESTLSMLVSNNEFVLLQDLFCAVNRLVVCDVMSPRDVYNEVLKLQEQGKCTLVNLRGVLAVFPPNGTNDYKEVVDILSKHPMGLYEFAMKRNISLALAEYQLLHAEELGYIVRDETVANIYYHVNLF
ncbi:bifunctional Snf8-Vps36 family/Winged helix DNA-binding domain superfamily/Vacuolar protein sorting protein 36/Winged helix-like DNA-binding domain superfamily [Babesia duncani]|uniref:Vacuolar protein-sorting-associated protein 36 n=1 Tax=Babesia duncani TaxID=323732 RepID=A0AAD9UPH3_9APIC|nr:bifunctional Snf8-Vps36 family/Winged helix DNA-binding domain superfamily/Vacuolar protein sorting protein 36/Winged helix-like DNA-binding domain superfamily [Babesia duncani]